MPFVLFAAGCGTECTPIGHQDAPLVEIVGAPIGSLDPVRNRVRQRGFGDLAGVAGLFRRPVPKGRTEAMNGVRQFGVTQDLQQGQPLAQLPVLGTLEGALKAVLDHLVRYRTGQGGL